MLCRSKEGCKVSLCYNAELERLRTSTSNIELNATSCIAPYCFAVLIPKPLRKTVRITTILKREVANKPTIRWLEITKSLALPKKGLSYSRPQALKKEGKELEYTKASSFVIPRTKVRYSVIPKIKQCATLSLISFRPLIYPV